jgi:hypothetical protein
LAGNCAARTVPRVRVNDRVQVTTQDGQSSYFPVTALGPDAIAGNTKRGDHVKLACEQINSLEVRRFGVGKSVALGVGVFVVVVALATVAVIDGFSSLGSGM